MGTEPIELGYYSPFVFLPVTECFLQFVSVHSVYGKNHFPDAESSANNRSYKNRSKFVMKITTDEIGMLLSIYRDSFKQTKQKIVHDNR